MSKNTPGKVIRAKRKWLQTQATTEKLFELSYAAPNGINIDLVFKELENRNLRFLVLDYCNCHEGDCNMHLENIYGAQDEG